MAAAASETGAVPRTAIQAVHDMLFELRALRAYAGTARISEEAHALSLHSATRLGLYSICLLYTSDAADDTINV